MASRCKDLDYKSIALTDHGTISGCIDFYKACNKKDIKPILGIECYIANDAKDQSKGSKNRHQVILAKNLQGWKNLIKLVSVSNHQENFYYKPRVDYNIMSEICGDMISFSGHPGSTLYSLVLQGDDKKIEEYIHLMWNIFGKENFFIEIQVLDDRYEVTQIVKELRTLADYYKIKRVATCDAHYAFPEQSDDHKVILCSSLKTTLNEVQRKIEDNQKIGLDGFFKLDRFHIPTPEEMIKYGNTEEEVENTQIISDMCEKYDILNKPTLPKFEWTEGQTESEYFRNLCRQGWLKRNINNKENRDEYIDRIKMELEVIHNANLEGYFLIVQDYVNYAKSQGWLLSHGRGSVGGCLCAYLTRITEVDPIQYGLLFERFYNSARSSSLPDIDIDFPKYKRDELISYIKGKYGENRVSQIATFGRLMGRAAIKEVLRIHNACDFNTMNQISKSIPHENEIADKLKESNESSILMWTLKNDPKAIQDYCRVKDDALEGDYANYFLQASRLEGTYKSQGKHAAAVIISPSIIEELVPMIRDKHGEKIIGFDMHGCEDVGLVKLDILSLEALDKLMFVNQLLGGNYET